MAGRSFIADMALLGLEAEQTLQSVACMPGTWAERNAELQARIKEGYKAAMRKWHPDVCKEANAEEMSKEINHAYECLQKVAIGPRQPVMLPALRVIAMRGWWNTSATTTTTTTSAFGQWWF